MRGHVWIRFALFGTCLCMQGQWLNYPTPGAPRTKDGKPDLNAPAPRAANGKPDLSGLWVVAPTPLAELPPQGASTTKFEAPNAPPIRNRYLFDILADFKPEDSPMLPVAKEIYRQRRLNDSADLPSSRCLPSGVPLSMTLPYPFKFIQTPGLLIVLHEGDSAVRQIYTDGRKHTPDPQPTYMCYSIGTWDSDTLVVDTIGFNDDGWLDNRGSPRSDALHTVERISRTDYGHLHIEVTLDDPKMYKKAFTVKFAANMVPDSDLQESVCAENEKDRRHFK